MIYDNDTTSPQQAAEEAEENDVIQNEEFSDIGSSDDDEPEDKEVADQVSSIKGFDISGTSFITFQHLYFIVDRTSKSADGEPKVQTIATFQPQNVAIAFFFTAPQDGRE